MDVTLPVGRDCARRSWYRLIQRVTVGAGQFGAVERATRPVVVKPILAGLEALDDRVAGCGVMGGGVLGWRCVTTADVPAGGTSPQVHPPAGRSGGQALHTTGPARWNRRVDLARR